MQATSALLMLVESHGSCEQSATSTALNRPYLSPLSIILWGLQLTFTVDLKRRGLKLPLMALFRVLLGGRKMPFEGDMPPIYPPFLGGIMSDIGDFG